MATTQKQAYPNDNSGDVPLSVPGFGLPIDSWISRHMKYHRFRHGANDFQPDRMTLREISMLLFMNTITEKPEWNKKILDDDIIEKWKQESSGNPLMSEKTFDWCIAELRDKAKAYEEKGYIRTFDTASVCIKSDTLISADIQNELKSAVESLIHHPDKDWHPNSNEQVLNLVHPSLYPLVYGRTRVLGTGTVGLRNCFDSFGEGDIAAANQKVDELPGVQPKYRMKGLDTKKFWSTRFQWLPCEVKFQNEESKGVKIVSYINNLNPTQHEGLYKVIEEVITASIQPWNEMVFRGYQGCFPLRIKTRGVECDPPGLPDWASEIEYGVEPTEQIAGKIQEYMSLPSNPEYVSDGNEDTEHEEPVDDKSSLLQNKHKRIRHVLHPEPGIAYSYEDWKQGKTDNAVVRKRRRGEWATESGHSYHKINIEKEFWDKGLQIIVKLSSIELTPQKPNYPGGSWHLEGMLNEHIVATSIYYYDVENVTESRISFRQEARLDDMKLTYEQDDHLPLQKIFGTNSMRDEPAIQGIGSIATSDGRFLAFPNTLQHRVEPFQLADPTKPGHRRFLVLWLVDPNIRIASTANVPPQQHEWWADAMSKRDQSISPDESQKTIPDNDSDWPMSMEEAKALRLELMQERTTFADQVELGFEEYNLCEH